ncbi:MAG: YHS domain-containing protein [Actinobacteria bacterium]|nr:YHS domain-containing protein [Actinomycetota bacterium]
MKIFKTLILALTLAAFAVGGAWAAEAKAPAAGKPQTQCPVLGGNINKQFYADYKGKRIYFCCGGCDAEFKKDPEKYMKKLQEQGIKLEPCPAGGEKK